MSRALANLDVKGIGKPMSHLKSDPDLKVLQFHPCVEIFVVLESEAVEEVLDIIVKTAQTGNLSDGKVFVLPVEEAIRVRTGER